MAENWQTILEDLKQTQTELNDEDLELAAKGWAIILAGPEHPKFQRFTELLDQAVPDHEVGG